MILVSKKYDKNHFCLFAVKSRTGVGYIGFKTPVSDAELHDRLPVGAYLAGIAVKGVHQDGDVKNREQLFVLNTVLII